MPRYDSWLSSRSWKIGADQSDHRLRRSPQSRSWPPVHLHHDDAPELPHAAVMVSRQRGAAHRGTNENYAASEREAAALLLGAEAVGRGGIAMVARPSGA